MKREIKEFFFPGEEWLYYKIYCGVNTTNTLLLYCIEPLMKNLVKEKLINKWFFIRYTDPDNHIRLRFLIKDSENIGNIILYLNESLITYTKTNEIWNITIDTYKREIERYGKNTIELSESFFFYNSVDVLTIIKNCNDEERLFYSIFSYLEQMVNSFEFSSEIHLSFLEERKNAFKKELNGMNKRTNKSLDLTYRSIKTDLSESIYNNKDIGISIKLIIEKIIKLKNTNKLELSLEELVSSFIHMTINRTFNSNQRIFEMLLYDFLYRKYKSIYARL